MQEIHTKDLLPTFLSVSSFPHSYPWSRRGGVESKKSHSYPGLDITLDINAGDGNDSREWLPWETKILSLSSILWEQEKKDNVDMKLPSLEVKQKLKWQRDCLQEKERKLEKRTFSVNEDPKRGALTVSHWTQERRWGYSWLVIRSHSWETGKEMKRV
jgi:hypothetical protein